MNCLLVLALMATTRLPYYSVKQALAVTGFRMDSGPRPDNETSLSPDDGFPHLPGDKWFVNMPTVETVDHEKSKAGVIQLLDCGKPGRCSGRCHDKIQEGLDLECRCDALCWFYGDCCLGYYEDCLQVNINDTDHTIMVAYLSKLDSYWQARNLRRVLKLIKLSTCSTKQNDFNQTSMYLVGECGADPETEMKFHAMRQKLTTTLPGQDINLFAGLSTEEFINKCRGSPEKRTKQGHNLETIPVTLVVDLYQVDFHNVFCAICNGIDPADVKYWDSEIKCLGVDNIKDYARGVILNVSDASTDHCNAEITIPKTARMRLQNHYSKNCSLASTPNEVELMSTKNFSTITQELINETGDNSSRSQETMDPGNELNDTRKGRHVNVSLDDKEQLNQSILRYEQLTCSAESERARYCQMYAYSFYIGAERYKNPHCLPCLARHNVQNMTPNFWESFACPKEICYCESIHNIILRPEIVQPSPGLDHSFTASFRVLFDFRGHKNMVMVNNRNLPVTAKICPENHTYVPHYQECREIVCPLGKHMVGSMCIADERCSSGQGGNGSMCDENISGGSFRERLVLIKTPKRITMILRFRYILEIQGYIDAKEALKGDSGLDRGSTDVSRESYYGQNGSPVYSGDDTINKSSIDKFSIVDRNTMRSLWSEASVKRGNDDRDEAIKRLSEELKGTLFSHISRSGGIAYEFNLTSDRRGNHVSVSFLCELNEADTISFLLANLALWLVDDNLTRLANENDFMFHRIEISSEPLETSSSVRSSERQPCKIWEELTFKKFKVYIDENGSHAFRFRNKSTNLSETMFNVIVDLNDEDVKVGISSANVGVCQQHMETPGCGYVYFNMSDFVIYQDNLLTTTRARDLRDFLGALADYERRTLSLVDFVWRFKQRYGLSHIDIYLSEYYIIADGGAFVCQNYSRNYNDTIMGNFTVVYSYMPTSFTEQIATVASLALSIVCLAVVLVVYGLVKELRNIPGKIVMSMSGTLLMAQVIFLFSTYLRGVACQVYAAVQHALWLASFAWLAVMAINLTYILYFQSHATSDSAFVVFSCLCWVLPFLLVGCLFAMDVTGLLNIQYGTNGICWIGNAKAMVYAFGVPLFTMLLATLVCAVFVLRAIRKSVKFRHKNTLNHSGEKTQLLLCVNLSLLMGFNWGFYFLAVATDITAMWTVFIVTNGSQGCYIFLCYVARGAILTKVMRHLNICHGKVVKSRYAQGSSTVSHRVTKTTTLTSITSMKNLHLVVNPRSSPSSSPTPSTSHFDDVIAL